MGGCSAPRTSPLRGAMGAIASKIPRGWRRVHRRKNVVPATSTRATIHPMMASDRHAEAAGHRGNAKTRLPALLRRVRACFVNIRRANGGDTRGARGGVIARRQSATGRLRDWSGDRDGTFHPAHVPPALAGRGLPVSTSGHLQPQTTTTCPPSNEGVRSTICACLCGRKAKTYVWRGPEAG